MMCEIVLFLLVYLIRIYEVYYRELNGYFDLVFFIDS